MGYWPIVKRVLKDSNVVLEIADARMPEISQNKELEYKAELYGKELILVFTKIDLVSVMALNTLRGQYPDAFFVSGVKNIGLKRLKIHLLIMAKRKGVESLRVGIVGYPNVGKSAVINALVHRARTKVSRMAGTTKGIQWIKAGGLSILDSPGVVPFEDDEVTLGIMGAKNPEKIKNVFKVAFALIKNFSDRNLEALEKFYGAELKDKDEYEILLEIGKKRGFLLKGGIVDEKRAAMQLLRDWQSGKLGI